MTHLKSILCLAAAAAVVGASAPKPALAPADPAIAFHQSSGAKRKIMVMNADGSNAAAVFTVNNAGSPYYPSWSPDGHAIAFTFQGGLWRVDVNVVNGVPTGSNAAVLVPDRVSILGVAWSPLGDEIVFPRYNSTPQGNADTLQVVGATGGTPQIVYTAPNDTFSCRYPAWSPDGRFIAFYETNAPAGQLGRSIKVLERSTGLATTVFDPQYNLIRDIDWARTQDRLAFAMEPPGQPRAVYTLSLAPGSTPQFVREGQSPSWSPDDSHLVIEVSGRIIKRNLTTGVETQINRSGSWPDWRRF